MRTVRVMTEKPAEKATEQKTTKNFTCFHCPVSGCLYYEGSQRHFANKRLLNQHLAKIHAEKKYLCSKCQKGFGLDWWRNYHEKTCGKKWECTCGLCYSSRESLLTHARRNYHNLPSDTYCPKRKNWKNMKSQAAQSLVIVIQGTGDKQLQNVPYVCQGIKENLTGKPRPILPKGSLPALGISSPSQDVEKNVVPNSNKDNDSCGNSDGFSGSTTCCNNSDVSNTFEFLQHSSTAQQEKKNGLVKTVAETQTNSDCDAHSVKINDIRRKKESRGSQCSGNMRKQNVRIESTETQTLESALTKMKRKNSLHRSRKKSVAITTNTEMNHVVHSSGQMTWSCMENFLFSDSNDIYDSWKKFNKYSSSTQTSHSDCNKKVLCDTHTITDDLIQFNWPLSSETKPDVVKSPSEMGADFTGDCTEDLNESNDMPILELFSSSDTSLCSLTSGGISIDPVTNENPIDFGQECNSVLSPMFSSCLLQEEHISQRKVAPIFSHTQTQTTTASDIEYCNVLSNMETQTTGDFLLPDLEFLDTETQTPWEDISSIEDTLAVHQLSREIQTDFPLPNTILSSDDHYDFMSDINMLGMLQNCTNKLSEVVNMETQTQYCVESPELTNSSAQTLDDFSACLFN